RIQQLAHAANRARRVDGLKLRPNAPGSPRRPRANERNGVSGNAGFLSIVLRNGKRPSASATAALHFRRRAVVARGREKVSGEIRIVDRFLLWRVRVRRNLL